MKNLIFIDASLNKKAYDILKNESELAYSESYNGFICYENVYKKLETKINFKEVDEDGDEVFYIWQLGELLKTNWSGNEYITLEASYSEYDKIEHDLGEDWETALAPYCDEDYPNHEEKVRELFTSDDWYEYILKDIKKKMLLFIADSIKLEAEVQIVELEGKNIN